MSYFPPPEPPPKSKLPTILGLCVVGGLAYYVFVHLPAPRAITIKGPDSRMNGTYDLIEEETTTRKHYDDNKVPHPTGQWANLVWKHRSLSTFIYDHFSVEHGQGFSIGPWNANEGGNIYMGRCGYMFLAHNKYEADMPTHKKKQTYGVPLPESINPVQPHDVMALADVHGFGAEHGWGEDYKPGRITLDG